MENTKLFPFQEDIIKKCKKLKLEPITTNEERVQDVLFPIFSIKHYFSHKHLKYMFRLQIVRNKTTEYRWYNTLKGARIAASLIEFNFYKGIKV